MDSDSSRNAEGDPPHAAPPQPHAAADTPSAAEPASEPLDPTHQPHSHNQESRQKADEAPADEAATSQSSPHNGAEPADAAPRATETACESKNDEGGAISSKSKPVHTTAAATSSPTRSTGRRPHSPSSSPKRGAAAEDDKIARLVSPDLDRSPTRVRVGWMGSKGAVFSNEVPTTMRGSPKRLVANHCGKKQRATIAADAEALLKQLKPSTSPARHEESHREPAEEQPAPNTRAATEESKPAGQPTTEEPTAQAERDEPPVKPHDDESAPANTAENTASNTADNTATEKPAAAETQPDATSQPPSGKDGERPAESSGHIPAAETEQVSARA